MSFAPLLNAPLQVQLHAFAAMTAFALGLFQFIAPKGRTLHRVLGFTWLGLMITVAISSFWIASNIPARLGPFGPIHLLSVWTLLMVPLAIYWARRRNIRGHASTVIGMFVGGLLIAGAFTFVPGRIMHAVAFGP